MNRRFGSVLVFAVVVAALASGLVYHFVLVNVEAASRQPQATESILIAARTLEVGTLIQESDLRSIQSPTAAPEQAIKNLKDAVGRGVIATIYQGESILSGRLAPKGAGAGLAAMIPIGKRAVALKVDEVVGLAGFVVPGMRVDVIVSGGNSSLDSGRNGVLTRTVLQNIEVLSAGQKIEKTADGKPQDAQVVNLLVTPDQAEVLSLASNETKVQLVLRNPLDTNEEKTHGTSVAALFGVAAQPAPKLVASAPRPVRPKPQPEVIEVFNGTKKTEQALDGQE
jgi:pilus assembly protein CpaB